MSNTTVASLKPYPLYKESGIPWLGQLPEHWKVVPNKSVMQLRKKTVGEHFADYTLLSLTKQGVIPRNLDEPTGKFPESFDTYQVAEPGDLILCLFDVDETPRTIGIAKQRGMVTGAYTRFVCTDETTREFTYLLYLSLDDQKALKPLYTGLRKVITKESFLAAKIALPPPGEQAAIVRYLDDADQRIRAYVSAKERLIRLLEEEKKAVIQQAVTRGLDPNVRLKPSGVEWLGDVPEHWEIRHLKNLTKFLNGVAFKPSDWKESGVPIIRIENLNGSNSFNYTDRTDISDNLLVQPRDLLFAWSGNPGTSFGSFEWDRDFPGYLNQHIFKVVEHQPHKQFFYYLLRAVTKHVEDNAHGIIGLVHITKPLLGAISVPLAPLNEQPAIARYIDMATARIASGIDIARRQIDLMNEYRTRLIADVVTGKLDVREAAERLPDPNSEDPLPQHQRLSNPTINAAL